MRNRQQNGWVEETGKAPRTWTGYFHVYENGKRLRRSRVLGKRKDLNKSQAEDVLRAYLRGEVTRIGVAAHIPMVVPENFCIPIEQYLRLKRGDWGKRNKAVMESLFKVHVRPTLGQMSTADIKPSDIKEWVSALAETQSKTIVQKCLTHVRAIFEQLIEDGALTRNPARKVRMPKNTRKVSSEFLTLDDCRKLMAASDGRDRLILRLLLSCALRPSELFALRLEDIHPGRLRIDEGAVPCDVVKETKTEESDGWVPLSADLEAGLIAYARAREITDPKSFLFGTSTGKPESHANYLRRKLRPLGVSAGVGKVTFQMMRRTVATHLQRHGEIKSAQGLLRHADPETTLKHYQQRLDPEVVKAQNSWDAELMGAVQTLKPRLKVGQWILPFQNNHLNTL